MLNTVLSSRVSRVRVRVSVRFSGRYKNLGPPFIGLPKILHFCAIGSENSVDFNVTFGDATMIKYSCKVRRFENF